MTCPHGFASPASCVECMEDGPVLPPTSSRRPEVEAVTAARFDGQCPECNTGIHQGQRIAKMSNSTWWHATCAEAT